MNKELFDSMQKQMTPSPEVRAALSEKLARPVKKRPVPWMKYGALAACAALVIGAFPLYQTMKDLDSSNGQEILWTHRAGVPLHSYVTVDEPVGYSLLVKENTTETGSGGEDTGEENYSTGVIDRNEDTYSGDILDHTQSQNTGDLPADTYLEWEQKSLAQQEAVNAYQKLMGHFALGYPNWYGGAYIDDNNNLMVLLVEDKDPGDKSLEQKVLNWTGSDKVIFSSCKYSLAQLKELMDRLNALPDSDPVCRDVMVGWGVDEEANRIELTLAEVNDHVLAILAELDPDDDAIYVQVGQRVTLDVAPGEVVGTDSAATEDPAVHHVMPGGATVPDDEDLIADEPVYEGAHYDVKELPEKLPKEEKRPAITVDSVPEEDASTSSYNPDAK